MPYKNVITTSFGKDKKSIEFFYCDLTYEINGILMRVHRELGQYAREKQYADLVEKYLKEKKIRYQRELRIGDTGNVLDFLIEDIVILELKAVPFLKDEHFSQVKRYLHQTNLKLGIIANFRAKHLQPKRVLNPHNL